MYAQNGHMEKYWRLHRNQPTQFRHRSDERFWGVEFAESPNGVFSFLAWTSVRCRWVFWDSASFKIWLFGIYMLEDMDTPWTPSASAVDLERILQHFMVSAVCDLISKQCCLFSIPHAERHLLAFIILTAWCLENTSLPVHVGYIPALNFAFVVANQRQEVSWRVPLEQFCSGNFWRRQSVSVLRLSGICRSCRLSNTLSKYLPPHVSSSKTCTISRFSVVAQLSL